MRMIRLTQGLRLAALLGAVLSWASAASAQNTSQATAASIGTGQAPAIFTLSPATPERWYVFKPQTYRSYCIEVLPAPDYTGPAQLLVDLVSASGTTGWVQGVNHPFNTTWDPHPGDRANANCDAIWPDEAVYARVYQTGASVGTTTAHQIRVVETTIFAPRFEVNLRRGVDSSILLSNTTSALFGVSVTVFDQAGHPLLSPPQIDINLTPYGSTELVLSSFGLRSAVGSVVISHFGGLGAVAADLETSRLTGRTSVPFRPRQDYRD
jgi:hypothetical protein